MDFALFERGSSRHGSSSGHQAKALVRVDLLQGSMEGPGEIQGEAAATEVHLDDVTVGLEESRVGVLVRSGLDEHFEGLFHTNNIGPDISRRVQEEPVGIDGDGGVVAWLGIDNGAQVPAKVHHTLLVRNAISVDDKEAECISLAIELGHVVEGQLHGLRTDVDISEAARIFKIIHDLFRPATIAEVRVQELTPEKEHRRVITGAGNDGSTEDAVLVDVATATSLLDSCGFEVEGLQST